VRKSNEDQFLIADLSKSIFIHQTSLTFDDGSRCFGGSQGSLMLVADGMGGHAGGGRASTLAVDEVLLYVLYTMPWFFRFEQSAEDELKDELAAALSKCHDSVRAESEVLPSRRGMGTTLTMAYIYWPRFYVVHVGDSRCYLLRGTQLRRITTDHTLAQEMVEAGAVEAAEAADSRLRSALWNTIGGTSGDLTIDVHKGDLRVGDTMLLCTDGLTSHVPDDAITKYLKDAKSAEDACNRLVSAANEGGGSDNITVVVASYGETEPQAVTETKVDADEKDASRRALPATEQEALRRGEAGIDCNPGAPSGHP
jgi:protein phosphatase